MENIIDRVIKGYELRQLLGEGGFGAVYRAYQPAVGREVAVKVILPEYANHPDFIRRFETEAQVVARLEHPFIVPLYDYWREPNGAYLVMRMLRGGSLGRRVLFALMDAARARGDREVVLHAQRSAVGFYARLGFAPRGEAFEEAGIPHQTMVKAL